jgi:hypothetical protein
MSICGRITTLARVLDDGAWVDFNLASGRA